MFKANISSQRVQVSVISFYVLNRGFILSDHSQNMIYGFDICFILSGNHLDTHITTQYINVTRNPRSNHLDVNVDHYTRLSKYLFCVLSDPTNATKISESLQQGTLKAFRFNYLLLRLMNVNETTRTRQSEMANTSPCHMPVLGNVPPIKIENVDLFL